MKNSSLAWGVGFARFGDISSLNLRDVNRHTAPGEIRKAYNLSERAHGIAVENLTRFGNVLSDQHNEALMRTVGNLSMLATGGWKLAHPRSSQRIAIPMDTGLGKTESVVAWAAAVHQLQLPLSVVVAASKVEALATLHRRFTESGIPEDQIALWHSKEFDPAMAERARLGDPKVTAKYASIPRTPDAELHARRFLLCSHERIRRHGDISYIGRPRSLVVWDESLLTSSSLAVGLEELGQVIGWLRGSWNAATEPDLRDALQWLGHAEQLLLVELERQKQEPASGAKVLHLPGVDPERVDAFRMAVRTEEARRRGRAAGMQTVNALLEQPYEPIRVLRAMKDEALITFSVSVPDHLRPVAILDASYPIRELEQLDSTIEPDVWFRERRLKTYSRVRGNLWVRGAGREAIEKDLDEVCREVVRVVRDEIPGESVLLVTHLPKRSRPDVAEAIRDALRKNGIDPAETFPDGFSRFGWLTFGSETSANDFTHMQNVIFVGALFRSDSDVGAAIAGQRRDLCGELTSNEIQRVLLSETAHGLYQGISRGACRVVENGEARPMQFWLMLPRHFGKTVKQLLDDRMPGVSWSDWVRGGLRLEDATSAINAYLDALPPEQPSVTLRRLKSSAALSSARPKTFQRARDMVLERREDWRRESGQLVRVA